MITFRYAADSIELPNPQLGDKQNNDYGVALDMAISSAVYSHIKTPERISLVMNFVDVDKTERDDFITFLENYEHLLVEFDDWLGTTWEGYFLDSFECATERNNRYRFSIQFEGTEQGSPMD